MIFVADSLDRRHREPELMDQPDLDKQLHEQALQGLARVNRISGNVATLWMRIRQLAKQNTGDGLHVLDVACGGGDTAIALSRRAKAAGIPIQISGCDISPIAVEFATAQAKAADVDVTFFQTDVIHEPLPAGIDVVCCSLFLHHLDEDDVIRLFSVMREAADRMILVNDLIRSRWGYLLAWCGIRILTRSRICHVDGPLSVRAAFTPDEAVRLAEQAGLQDVEATRHWPQRFLLTWRRT